MPPTTIRDYIRRLVERGDVRKVAESGRRALVPPRRDAAGPAARRTRLARGSCRLRAARAEPGAAGCGLPRLGRGAAGRRSSSRSHGGAAEWRSDRSPPIRSSVGLLHADRARHDPEHVGLVDVARRRALLGDGRSSRARSRRAAEEMGGGRVYRCPVELLERDGALAALAEARDAAARGEGRVVFVTGEPGIGKTSLVDALPARTSTPAHGCSSARCDDLSIPRPLGPLRDLVGSVSTELDGGARPGGASHDDPGAADRGARARRRGRRCSCSRTCTGRTTRRSTRSPCSGGGSARCRRSSCSPSATARCRPAIRCTRPFGAVRADDLVFVELEPLSEERGRLARGRRRAATTVRRHRRQPVLRHRAARLAGRPPSCRPRSRTRCSGGRRGSTTPRGASSSSSRSCRTASAHRCSTR